MRFGLPVDFSWLAAGAVLAYLLMMLVVPCLPIADPEGQWFPISRGEFWLLYASVPSSIGMNWTGGGHPIVLFDRLAVLGTALAWVLSCGTIGYALVHRELVLSRLSRTEQIGMEVLAGQAALGSAVFLIASGPGTRWLPWSLLVLLAAAAWFIFYGKRNNPNRNRLTISQVGSKENTPRGHDVTFSTSMHRRTYGLLWLVTVALSLVMLLGSILPSQDMTVRENEWARSKSYLSTGRISWSDEHLEWNEPSTFSMSTLACMAFWDAFSQDTWQPVDERGASNRVHRIYIGALAGKTIRALIFLLSVAMLGAFLSREYGSLCGLWTSFTLIATPGLWELIRLGRIEAMTSLWAVGILVLWYRQKKISDTPLALKSMCWLIVGGATTSYATAALVATPALFLIAWNVYRTRSLSPAASIPTYRDQWPRFASIGLFAIIAIGCAAVYSRNLFASGDPIYPWGTVAASKMSLYRIPDSMQAFDESTRVPAQTLGELLSSNNSESGDSAIELSSSQSAYRWSNVLDALGRVLWNSSSHGLILIPMALLGIFASRFAHHRLAIAWFGWWVGCWWLFSVRQDRDWMPALILLGWLFALGVQYWARRLHGLWTLALCGIAMIWSLVVLPVFPTLDNRLLVSIEHLRSEDRSTLIGSEIGEQEPDPLLAWLANRAIASNPPGTLPTRWLMIGSADTMELAGDTLSNGPFNASVLDKDLSDDNAIWRELQTRQITHVLVDWEGLRVRESVTGQTREAEYRSWLIRSLKSGQLVAIPLQRTSGNAELFRVKSDR